MKKLKPDETCSTPHIELDGWEATKLYDLIWKLKRGYPVDDSVQYFERAFVKAEIPELSNFRADKNLIKWPADTWREKFDLIEADRVRVDHGVTPRLSDDLLWHEKQP